MVTGQIVFSNILLREQADDTVVKKKKKIQTVTVTCCADLIETEFTLFQHWALFSTKNCITNKHFVFLNVVTGCKKKIYF